MNKNFSEALAGKELLLFDGGYGTLLQKRGMPVGISPELFGMQKNEVIAQIHKEYAQSGANIITTNTFGGSHFKLGSKEEVFTVNKTMAEIARSATGGRAYIAGSVGPVGHFVKPLGPLSMQELVAAFSEQIKGLVAGGVDLILAETHFDLAEVRAVVIAAREVCDLPVAVSMTFEKGVSLTGTSPEVFVHTLYNMGVDFIGTNCSAGPEDMYFVLEELIKHSKLPVFAQANAGLPELDANGDTVFRLDAESFAEQSARFTELGVKAIGGCCGSTPEHIAALAKRIASKKFLGVQKKNDSLIITSRTLAVPFSFEDRAVIIGERINPTGKAKLTQELQENIFIEAFRLAEEQLAQGAAVLDVNVGAPLVDEQALLPKLIQDLIARFTCPFCLDSTNQDAIADALYAYAGSPLVNSISGEHGKIEFLGPLCKKFGAPFIFLPIKGEELPLTAKERIVILDELLKKIEELKIPKHLILVDVLALTVSSQKDAAKHCLEFISYCKSLGLPTTQGLSNISFGLPARELLNSSYLSLCLAKGATSFIANPNSRRLKEALYASEVLLGKDLQAERYIQEFANWTAGETNTQTQKSQKDEIGSDLYLGVLKGKKDEIVSFVEKALADGQDAFSIVNNELIPAILAVGEKYETKEYFLPQLLISAETMQKAFVILQPLLDKEGTSGARPKIIMATVEGDIHDIGKNISCLMLKNHGLEVIDLGKNIKASEIVAAAKEHNADIIGLSALMTTTMVKMEDTIKLLAEEKISLPVVIGGAVVTDKFCQKIGAAGFATDALLGVRIIQELLKK